MNPAANEIFADMISVNTWTNRTPRQISRTGVDGSIPISTPIYNGMSKSPNPASSNSNKIRGTGNRITIGGTALPVTST